MRLARSTFLHDSSLCWISLRFNILAFFGTFKLRSVNIPTFTMAPTQEPIALIGSACRFPGGCNTPSKLWELLRKPRDLLKRVPKNRFDIDAFYHPDATHHGTTDVQHSYFLDEDPAKFDAQFFGIQPMESDSIDPQQRMLLETVYDSLNVAGLPMESLKGSSTAVYVGLMCDDWYVNQDCLDLPPRLLQESSEQLLQGPLLEPLT